MGWFLLSTKFNILFLGRMSESRDTYFVSCSGCTVEGEIALTVKWLLCRYPKRNNYRPTWGRAWRSAKVYESLPSVQQAANMAWDLMSTWEKDMELLVLVCWWFCILNGIITNSLSLFVFCVFSPCSVYFVLDLAMFNIFSFFLVKKTLHTVWFPSLFFFQLRLLIQLAPYHLS